LLDENKGKWKGKKNENLNMSFEDYETSVELNRGEGSETHLMKPVCETFNNK